MNIEKEIFAKTQVDFKKLKEHGFKKEDNHFIFSKNFMDNQFKAVILVGNDGKVSGKVYDLEMDEEYTNIRLKTSEGNFVSTVRENYQNILKEIRDNCFQMNFFHSKQANRITQYIIEKYQDQPEFFWEKYPGYGVFRNPNNRKWYALIMNIDKSKIDKKNNGEVEIINLKIEKNKIPILLNQSGFYPSYHMNKKNWLTIVLDDTIPDKEIIEYVTESHNYTDTTTK